MMNRLDPQKVLSKLNLPAAWAGRESYVIALYDTHDLAAMLLVWQAWKNDLQRPRRLHFICATSSLLSAKEWVAQASQQLPDFPLKQWIEQLAGAWPLDVPGVQRTELDGLSVTLTWCLGSTLTPEMLGVSVDDVLHTSGLGRGDPDEPPRLIRLESVLQSSALHPWSWAARVPSQRRALVVGAGFAGMGIAYALAIRGWRVTVLDQGWQRPGEHVHATHLAAALTPVASKDDNARARLSRAGTLCAHQRWSHLDESIVSRCGALQLQRSTGRTAPLSEVVAALGFSHQWISHVSAEQASDLAGLNVSAAGLWYPYGCLVRPGLFLNSLSQTAGVDVLGFDVRQVRHERGQWHAVSDDGQAVSAPLLVMANAGGIRAVLRNSNLWPEQGRLSQMHALAGQITMVPKERLVGGPRCIVGGDGYVLPAVDGWCVSGGTYVRGAEQAEITEKGVQENLYRVVSLLGLKNEMDVCGQSNLPGWAGWRAVLPGRLPAIGPLEGRDGLWIATGYASRGLTWSALAGELIAGFLESEPLLLEEGLLRDIAVF